MQELIELFESDLARETIVSLWVHVVLLGLSLFVGVKALKPIKAILTFPFSFTKGKITNDLERRFDSLMERYERVLRTARVMQQDSSNLHRDFNHMREVVSMLKHNFNDAKQEPFMIDHSWTAAGDGTFKVESTKKA